MNEMIEGNTIRLRPHYKSHKCAEPAHRQIASGAASMMGLIPCEIEEMKEVVRNKIGLFGSDGRA
ncbi:MAG: hypothetical protein IKG23_04910 [Clostridia bacterium]|nr:hypothetical protein [Clostridia bacterium]